MFRVWQKTLCLVGLVFILISCLRQTPPAPVSSPKPASDQNTLTSTVIPSGSSQSFDTTGTATFTAVAPGTVACSIGVPMTPQTPPSPDFLDGKDVPMRWIPAGDFIMGSDYDYLEKPVHTVYLDNYYIDKYEVTNGSYKACVDAGVCQPPSNISTITRTYYFGNPGYDHYPVSNVDWDMARTYCETWRGFRLPTEAEWEKAARGTDGRSYPWGTCSIDHTYTDYIFEWGDLYDSKPVGSYEKGISVYGVYDMIGSLSEWVNDWFAETYDPNLLSNPQGPESGLYRVVRGYASDRNAIRVTKRIGYDPTENIGYVGFRCASDGTSQLQASLTQVVYPPTPTKTPDPSDYMDQAGIPMRLVPAGSFLMGSENGQADEKPMHTIQLDAYYIDKYEVTNASYKTCVAAGVCPDSRVTDLGSLLSYSKLPIYDDYPAAVDWEEAKTFCGWRGAQLPTEAQWEKAARGTEGRTYPWGDGADCSKANFHDKNFACAGNPVQVGSFEDGKSVYGLYDMAGNILEWVADWYSETYYQDSPSINPLGPDSGTLHVLRGGGYYSDALYIRSSARVWTTPGVTGYGFRCVKPAS